MTGTLDRDAIVAALARGGTIDITTSGRRTGRPRRIEIVFFAMFDPLDFNMRLQLSREAVYTVGFVAFWALGMLSSALTLLLQRPDEARESPPS